MKITARLHIILLASCLGTSVAWAQTPSIPADQIGAMAGKQYSGDGLSVLATPDGARLRSAFQKIHGDATRDGLWITSTDEDAPGRLRLIADVIRRGARVTPLGETGIVRAAGDRVVFARAGLVEEYRTSADGVRQDFVVMQRPEGMGELRVELALTGARAAMSDSGPQLTFDGSARVLAYSRLAVTDANGRALIARIEVLTPGRLTVRVADDGARYPVRIDPTYSDADWVSLNAGMGGVNDIVHALIIEGANVYLGGRFTFAGSVSAARVAKWDGSTWSALGTGMNNHVNALALIGGELYAGGSFTTAGGLTANRVARWNGSAWSALGTGMNGAVNALAAIGSDLYAGGAFTTSGGVTTNRIAKWNGSAWSILGTGMNDAVNALAAIDTDLYAGGAFTTSGGGTTNRIAKWNGSAWSALGSGANAAVSALAVSGADLYVGGSFTTAGGGSAARIAKWNGSIWSALGSGMDQGVLALAVSGSNVYAGGSFTTAGGASAMHIARWDGSAWSPLAQGMPHAFYSVFAVAVSGSSFYAGGSFTYAGGARANNLASWNGSVWSAVGPGSIKGYTMSVAAMGDDLFVVGSEGVVRKWNGSVWSDLGTVSPIPSTGFYMPAMTVIGTELYVGGTFTSIGGVAANSIARWNGSAWSALGNGLGGGVSAIAVSGGDIYAGSGSYVFKWNGSAWSSLPGTNDEVFALAVIGPDLYVGGYFTLAGGVPCSKVARWNGSSWSSVGSGLSSDQASFVNALAVTGTDLYAGGIFVTAGGGAAKNIAKWNGSAWSALGSGINNTVYTLMVRDGDLYAGGYFSTAGGVAANNIAVWSGSAWSALGSGVDGPVWDLAPSQDGVILGGDFLKAGTTTSPYVVAASPGANTAPTISDIANLTINEDTATTALAFTVGDAQTAAGSLTVSGSSNNTTVVPTNNVVFGGSGGNRTVTVTPAANQSGAATITVTVSDGTATTTDTFVLTVNAINDAPTITSIAAQTIRRNTPTSALAITVGDVETAAASLSLSGGSSNTTVVPVSNIVFGGSGASRTVTVTPASGQSGVLTITVSVGDGAATTDTAFELRVTYEPFTDDTLTSGQTMMRAVHITELRTRIEARRSAAGLGSFSYTDATLSAGATMVRAAHILELRTALTEVYTALSMTAPSFTDASLAVGSTMIRAIHIQELRDFVGAIEP